MPSIVGLTWLPRLPAEPGINRCGGAAPSAPCPEALPSVRKKRNCCIRTCEADGGGSNDPVEGDGCRLVAATGPAAAAVRDDVVDVDIWRDRTLPPAARNAAGTALFPADDEDGGLAPPISSGPTTQGDGGGICERPTPPVAEEEGMLLAAVGCGGEASDEMPVGSP